MGRHHTTNLRAAEKQIPPENAFPVYLDAQATTPVDPRVVDAMLPYETTMFGNPHSRNHAFGFEAEDAVEASRHAVAQLIGADPREVVFTSGATESNNACIKGVIGFYGAKRHHIVTTVTEHKCVLDACRALKDSGAADVTYVEVDSEGLVDPEAIRAALRPTTALVSVMLAHNEIGVVQPIAEIGQVVRDFNEAMGASGRRQRVLLHTDAAQAVGKFPVDVNALGVDYMSISGHKLYGPKGVGALYVRRKPRARLLPIISGGGQERGMRSGTLAPALVVGMGAACSIAQVEMDADAAHTLVLRQRLLDHIVRELDHIEVNGSLEHRLDGNLNISFGYVEGESLLMYLNQFALSSGSACTSASLEPSYVLRALGRSDVLAHSSIRFGFSRFTTAEEVDILAERVVTAVNKLRDMSPLWEMMKEGIDISQVKWTA